MNITHGTFNDALGAIHVHVDLPAGAAPPPAPVPAPAPLALLGVGLLGMLATRRTRG